MSYNSTILTTVTECDTVLNMANKEKSNLELRRLNMLHAHNNYGEDSVAVEAELAGIIAHIAALEMFIGTLPEGAIKEKTLNDLRGLEQKRYRLTNRKDNYGAVASLDREFDIERIEREIEEADAFIAVITTRKNEL